MKSLGFTVFKELLRLVVSLTQVQTKQETL